MATDYSKVAVFEGGRDYTPEQLLLELLRFADKMQGLAVIIQWPPDEGHDEGAFQAGWTRMKWSDVYLGYAVGQDKIMGELRGDRRIEQELG